MLPTAKFDSIIVSYQAQDYAIDGKT